MPMRLRLIDRRFPTEVGGLLLTAPGPKKLEHQIHPAQNVGIPNATIERLSRKGVQKGLTVEESKTMAAEYLKHYFGHLPGLAGNEDVNLMLTYALFQAFETPRGCPA